MKKKYKEIWKLKKLLENAKIPFDWIEGWGYSEEETMRLKRVAPDLMERYQICYPKGSFKKAEDRWISVIEGFGTYGAEKDKLEIMGGLTPMERLERYKSPFEPHTTIQGWLTARNVFNRIKENWEGREKQ